jgi:hypothetical protein
VRTDLILAYSTVHKSRLVDAVYLYVLAECCFVVRAVIIKLTRIQEGGIREGGIGILERKGLKGADLAWAHSAPLKPTTSVVVP